MLPTGLSITWDNAREIAYSYTEREDLKEIGNELYNSLNKIDGLGLSELFIVREYCYEFFMLGKRLLEKFPIVTSSSNFVVNHQGIDFLTFVLPGWSACRHTPLKDGKPISRGRVILYDTFLQGKCNVGYLLELVNSVNILTNQLVKMGIL